MDVMAKVLYLNIIVDVHNAVFDETTRSERRLQELRKMMSAVWESSSDIIAISVRGGIGGDVSTMVSPTYLQLYNTAREATETGGAEKKTEANNLDVNAKGRALVFELDANCFQLNQQHQQQQMSQSLQNQNKNKTQSTDPSSSSPRPSIHPRAIYDTDFQDTLTSNTHDIVNDNNSSNNQNTTTQYHKAIQQEEISSLADLVVKAWTNECTPGKTAETLIMHDLIRRCDNVTQDDKKEDDLFPPFHKKEEETEPPKDEQTTIQFETIRCEAKINRLELNALVIVVRDISERFRRFEAEKRVVFETTAREKDAEANRFTRHEVKNGLLAAIGLCEGLKETMPTTTVGSAITNGNAIVTTSATATTIESSSQPSPNHQSLTNMLDTSTRLITELDKTLREVLDTILAEAMARDVIHEVYEPRLERVDICELLCGISATQEYRDGGFINRNNSNNNNSATGNNICGTTTTTTKRFPLIVHPSPMPHFAFDPQLLRYIHRNAVSNACKYGQRGGVVLTEVMYDDKQRKLNMKVINLPGEHHEDILAMGDDIARKIVFSPGRRLHRYFEQKRKSVNGVSGAGGGYTGMDGGMLQKAETEITHSSGDGAWIMQKCAKTLGGDCSIAFEPNRTIFSLSFPAVPCNVSIREKKALDPTQFSLPPNTWGIAIDDSKIQRKLMDRYFKLIGIKQDKTIIVGKDADEISGFVDFVVDFLDQKLQNIEDENHYFLIIADENLDIMEDETHHVTVSGSMCVESIRRRLLPEQERRVCALIRSANDSSQDVAIYNSRAHGFLPKVPIRGDRVMETLAPLWERRFPPPPQQTFGFPASSASILEEHENTCSNSSARGESKERKNKGESSVQDHTTTANTVTHSLEESDGMIKSNRNNVNSSGNEDTKKCPSDDDDKPKEEVASNAGDDDDEEGDYEKVSIMQTIDRIDSLCTKQDANGNQIPPEELWLLVWEKLHSLKGDLQSMYDSTTSVVSLIDSLRGPVYPYDFGERWKEIRSHVVSMY
uniref:Uncharacterized protein n=1 Tax=Ditylum brightwellii TaxID=49249 RepID=A0A7S1YS11_9STRA|mmetsp:Transcript_15700/g.23286  ORF Transcript_15700/g.23286 Transcript_15700/m.23286 type:complete len:1008 (+) Transcript_15700:74-3097(+)